MDSFVERYELYKQITEDAVLLKIPITTAAINYEKTPNWMQETRDICRRPNFFKKYTDATQEMVDYILNSKGGVVATTPVSISATTREAAKDETDTNGNRAIVSEGYNRPISFEDFCEIYKVDMTKWECLSWKPNIWNVGAKDAEGNMSATSLFQAKATFAPIKKEFDPLEFLEVFKAQLNGFPSIPKPNAYQVADAGQSISVLHAYDVHLGKRAYGEDKPFGEDFLACIDAFINTNIAQKIFRARLVIGGDFFNHDTPAGTTTGGTPVANNLEYRDMFAKGCALVAEAISRLSATHSNVDVVIISGNHDKYLCYHLHFYIAAIKLAKNVSLRPYSANGRIYVLDGCTLIGYTHGKAGVKNLGGVMPNEQPMLWAKSKHREFVLGDKHTKMFHEQQGVWVVNVGSISPSDEWHEENAFIGNRRCMDVRTYHDEHGFVGQYSIFV